MRILLTDIKSSTYLFLFLKDNVKNSINWYFWLITRNVLNNLIHKISFCRCGWYLESFLIYEQSCFILFAIKWAHIANLYNMCLRVIEIKQIHKFFVKHWGLYKDFFIMYIFLFFNLLSFFIFCLKIQIRYFIIKTTIIMFTLRVKK